MRLHQLVHYAGVAAYVNAVANIVGAVALVVFFTVGEPFGTINDSASVVSSLSLIPPALAVCLVHRPPFPVLSVVSTGMRLAAMLTATLLQSLLVLGAVQFGQMLRAVLLANAIIGAWLVAAGLMARRAASLPPYVAWLMRVAGSGLVVVIDRYP